MMLSATAIGPCAVLTGHRLDVRMLLRRKSREGERPCIVNADDSRQVANLVDIVWCAEDCDALPSVLDGISRLSDFMRPYHTAHAVMLEEFPRNVRTEAQAHTLERRLSQYWADSLSIGRTLLLGPRPGRSCGSAHKLSLIRPSVPGCLIRILSIFAMSLNETPSFE